MKAKYFSSRWLAIPVIVFLSSFSRCDQNRVFEKNTKVSDYHWSWENKISFEVEIEDTTSLYNIYLNIRHGWQYPYSNLWVIVHTYFPNGDHLERRVQIEMADKSGKPYADCSGDICDLQVPIQQGAYFEKPGKYKWEIEQNMRQNPLPMIMAVGLRLEKAGAKNSVPES